jgi:hypothetical protein
MDPCQASAPEVESRSFVLPDCHPVVELHRVNQLIGCASVTAAIHQGILGKGLALIEELHHQIHWFVFHTLVLYPGNQLTDLSDNAIGGPG